MSSLTQKIVGAGIVPVVVIKDVSKAEGLARALCAGGIPVAEVTFRTESAQEAIREIARNVPEIIVGAGTVHTVEQAKAAVESGAKFIVTPGFAAKTVQWCVENGIPVFPGCSGPAEIESAMEFGLSTVKFFPAEAYGGIKTLKALSGPYGGIRFMPTGGINEKNIGDYLALPSVAACGGSWMVPAALVEQGDFAGITALCRQAVRSAFGFELLHVGINSKDAQEAKETADAFAGLFSLPVSELPGAYFAGSLFEIVKKHGLGKNGHIAIQTNNLDRAIAYFETRGEELDPSTKAFDDAGKLVAVYFKKEIAGFAVHLRKKD